LREASCCSVDVVKGAAGLALLDREDRESRILEIGDDLIGAPSVVDLGFHAVDLNELRRKDPLLDLRTISGRAADLCEACGDRPKLARNEALDFAFAIDDQPNRYRLDAPG
jgi:hypothetical protein